MARQLTRMGSVATGHAVKAQSVRRCPDQRRAMQRRARSWRPDKKR